MSMKVHFSTPTGAACGRVVRRISAKVRDVDCKVCMLSDAYAEAKQLDDADREAAFWAQEPRKVSEPWHQPYGSVPMVCKGCGNDTFREADRSCYGHYANWVCAACGDTESRLTETGMSF
jgi:hypothetical protein